MAGFADLMNESITVNTAGVRDKYGKRTYAQTAKTYPNCRIQTGKKLVRDLQGKEVFETGRVYILGSTTIVIGDKVTLPSGETPTVILVDDVSDENGHHHTVLHFAGE